MNSLEYLMFQFLDVAMGVGPANPRTRSRQTQGSAMLSTFTYRKLLENAKNEEGDRKG